MKVLAILVLAFVACDAMPKRFVSYEEHVYNGGLPLPESLRGLYNPYVESNSSRIVGGVEAVAGDAKWIVSLKRTASGSHFCGGSIYNARTIITAAHCISGSSKAFVRYNSLTQNSGGAIIESDKVVWHGSYNSATIDNDVGVITLLASLTLGQQQADPVKLPAQGSDPAEGTNTLVAGWGTTREGGSVTTELRKVDVPIVGRTKCRAQYGASAITDNMVCAGIDEGGKDACQGDSGGPLTNDQDELVGIVSWGRGCARAGYAGVYTRTANYITWIQSQAAN